MSRDRDRILIDLVRRSVPAGGSVLDIGCGPGSLADLVAGEVPNLSWTGVDLLPEAITEAREQRPWATWIEASADALPIGNASIDVVVASTLFSSLPSGQLERDAAAEVGRVLRPGGWLVWYDLRYGNPGNRSVHGLGQNAVRHLFPGWRAELRPVTLIPPLARRLGSLTGVLYGPLERLPFLRSHLVGRLRRP
jgi:ubiquinone/menaquinone biosynthesis C-methylase UbiE